MKKDVARRKVEMKQRKLVLMIGMLILPISIILVAGCSTFRPVQTTAQFPADGSKYVKIQFKDYLNEKNEGGHPKFIYQVAGSDNKF